ncbi:MAG: Tol-Pal system protein TolB, partial [Rhizobiaceae bacterium]|nr:Tol-Pal system protein TolB [Rhizobiaceae bacterium]
MSGFLAALVISISSAHALVEIDITKGNVEPFPIAITNFSGQKIAQDIAAIVEADLRNSGLFRPLDK